MKTLMQRVETLFDWIIVDSPPAVPVSDASQLANYCDGVLMVVRSNATPYDTAQQARGRNLQGKTTGRSGAQRNHARGSPIRAITTEVYENERRSTSQRARLIRLFNVYYPVRALCCWPGKRWWSCSRFCWG